MSLDDIEKMPILMDKVEFGLYSKRLGVPYGMCKRVYEVDKADLTKAVREYHKSSSEILGKCRMSGKPIIRWKKEWLAKWRVLNMSLEGYNRFSSWVVGNPTRFQKDHYSEALILNEQLDDAIRIHDSNYLYPFLLDEDVGVEKFLRDNQMHRPDLDAVGYYLSEKVLELPRDWIVDWESDQAMYMGAYTDGSVRYVEFNRDLYLPDGDALDVFDGLLKYVGKHRKELCYQYNSRLTVSSDCAYVGGQILFVLPVGMGNLKLYVKTHRTIRCEVVFQGADLMNRFGTKSSHMLVSLEKEVVPKTLGVVDAVSMLRGNGVGRRKGFDDLLFRVRPSSEKEWRFWDMVKRFTYVPKEAVPEAYLSSGKYKLVEAVRVRIGVSRGAKRRVMYRLKFDLLE